MYEHLNLKALPFQYVPDAQFAAIWAGRRESKKQLDRMLWKMQFSPASNIYLLWANFGMGKTHTLYHLQHLAKNTKGKLIPVYAVMPQRANGFLDLYRAIVTELPFDFLCEQIVKVGAGTGASITSNPIFRKSPGVVNAMLAIRSHEIERETIGRQWLSTQPGLTNADLHKIGVTYRLRTPEDAVSALTALTLLATFNSNPPSKLVIMVDEFQRVGELREKYRQEINSGIHTYYNQNPNGVGIILSFSFGVRDNVKHMLNKEVQSRAEPETINLDVLGEQEAEEFVHDLLDQFRINRDDRWAFPFTPESVRAIIKHIRRTKPLTPRRLMLYLNYVFMESQYSRDPGDVAEITADEARMYLANPRLGEMDLDEPPASN